MKIVNKSIQILFVAFLSFCTEGFAGKPYEITQISYGDQLSGATKGTLAFFDSLNGAKLFGGFPDDINDKAAWIKKDKEVEQQTLELSNKLVKDTEASVAEVTFNRVQILDVKPAKWIDNGKVFVYIHGGAFVSGSAQSLLLGAVPLANASKTRVIVVDYEKAPMAQYMEITGQVIEVIKHLNKSYDMHNIAIYGDSAGGNIALSSILQMRDAGHELPAAIALWSPWLDIDMTDYKDKQLYAKEPILDIETGLARAALAYAPASKHKDPYVSPVYDQFEGELPPVLIIGGSRDILRHDWDKLASKLKKAGKEFKYILVEDLTHVFMVFNSETPEGKADINRTSKFFEYHLGK